ncbi:MAG TPA: hypothetical protein VIP51_04710 [Eoetvoesiella sp.]
MNSLVPLLLSAQDVAKAAPSLAEIIGLVEETYRMDAGGQVDVPTKVGVHPHGPQSFLHAMPAWVAGRNALGMKWVSFFPGNSQRGLPDSSALIVLNDPEHGLPVAIMEGMWITYARTSACAALAAKYCANPTPTRLGLVGCGGLGEWSLRALTTAFPSIDEVFVSSLRPQSRQEFCSTMAEQGPWRLRAVDNMRDAIEEMDIVVSSVPKLEEHPIQSEWWTAGTLMVPLDVTGAWSDAIYQMADRLVCDHRENLVRALERYRPNLKLDESRTVMVQDLVTDVARGRSSKTDRTLAFMTGISSLDMTVAWEIYRRARKQGLGTSFALS